MSITHVTRTTGLVSVRRSRLWTSRNGRLWLLQVVLAIAYLGAAMPKLGHDPQLLANFADLGISAVGMHTIGVLEVAGAAGLLIPRLVGLAAAALGALMIGAVSLTVVHLGVLDAVAPAVFLVVVVAVAWCRRDRMMRLAAGLAAATHTRMDRQR